MEGGLSGIFDGCAERSKEGRESQLPAHQLGVLTGHHVSTVQTGS